MEKYIYDENNGLWYELQGDYYIPCLKLPDEEQVEIGIWGQRHLEYIKHHRKGFYTSLVLDCKLNRYLADINKQSKEMFDRAKALLGKGGNKTVKDMASASATLGLTGIESV